MALAVGMVMLWLRRVCGRVRVQPASAPSWLANLRPQREGGLREALTR